MKKTEIFSKHALVILILIIVPLVQGFSQCSELIWSDEFDGTEIDTTKWFLEVNDWGGGNNELQYYTDRPENAKVENGKLIITALKEDYLTREYTSARLVTKNLGDWKYGRFEASIKVPEGQGMWPAFWLLSTDNKYGDWPNSGEIDIMELLGHLPEEIHGTIHTGPPYALYQGSYTIPSGKFSDDFHVFAVEWEADSIRWYVDGIKYHELSYLDVDAWEPFMERFHMILNLAVGGNWPGNPDQTTVFPATMEVDYVRVYGDPETQPIVPHQAAYPNAKNVAYSTAQIPSATYQWTLPAGATITSNPDSSNIMVDWGCTPGDVSVTINSTCGTSVITETVSFAELRIDGDTLVYEYSAGVNYSLPEMSGTTFNWNIPSDATLQTGQGTESITMDWACTAGAVSVQVTNACFDEPVELPVAFIAPSVTGFESVLENATGQTYSVDEVPSATYTWSVPADATIASGQGTSSITVDFGVTQGNVSVDITNTCGTNNYGLPVSLGNTIVFCTYEGSSLVFETFASSEFEIIGNPFSSGINTSAHVGKTYKSATTWSGIYADLPGYIDFSLNNTFKIKVYGPKAGEIRFKLEDKNQGSTFVELGQQYTTSDEWQELSFDFSGTASDTYDRITLFFDFGSADDNWFYFDDIVLTYVEYTGVNGMEQGKSDFNIYPNPARDHLFIRANDPTQALLQLELITLDGRVVYSKSYGYTGASGPFRIGLKGMESGVYLLKIKSNLGTEYERIVIE